MRATRSYESLSKVWRCTTISNLMINEQIRDREVRLIGADGEQLGIVSSREAQKIADETAKIFSSEAAKLLNVTNVNILSKAKAQTTPISPKPKLYLAISVIAGLVLGLAIALLKELFDNKINKEEDIEALGLTVLGVTTYAQISDFNKNTNKNGTQSGTKSSPPSDHEVNRSSKRNKR